MLFSELIINKDRPIYEQIRIQIVNMIEEGMLASGSKLPSTRELADILKVSRNSCIHAYEILEDEGYIYTVKGKGAFIADMFRKINSGWNIDWSGKLNSYAELAEELDIMKKGKTAKGKIISFRSIAPDEKLFDMEIIRRNILNRLSIEEEKLFNYGYARGYKPLIEYLRIYMGNKGIDMEDKDILITNGFTEGFDIVLASITARGDQILCENPTHNTAIKIMRLYGLEIVGVNALDESINIDRIEDKIKDNKIKLAYFIPSYHNPTGRVLSAGKRKEIYDLCRKYQIPIIEDGFNEELFYSSSHVSSIAALAGSDNSVIYIGSFSKILFPGIRVGWILADKNLIKSLESVKRSRNIHTSVLDQSFLYEYLNSGEFDVYIKKARRFYRDKYEYAVECAKKYIPCKKVYGEGGLHIFIEFENLDCNKLLDITGEKGVLFMPGDIFFTDGKGQNTIRLGFSRVTFKDIEKGVKIIGESIAKIKGEV